jgi:hypothetical protein
LKQYKNLVELFYSILSEISIRGEFLVGGLIGDKVEDTLLQQPFLCLISQIIDMLILYFC